MPRLAICSRDLHWHWINRTLLCDTMEVSMLSRAWLTIAQHVFQPALTGRPELISRKIVSGEPGTKAIAVSRFREKLSPANWVQGVTAISRKISRSWAPKKWGPTCDRDISNSAIYTTAIYRAYTVLLTYFFNTHVPVTSKTSTTFIPFRDFSEQSALAGPSAFPCVVADMDSMNNAVPVFSDSVTTQVVVLGTVTNGTSITVPASILHITPRLSRKTR